MGHYAYSRGMASNLIRLLSKHQQAISSTSPTPSHTVNVAMQNALKLKSAALEDFDNAFTSKAGGSPVPHGPFPFKSAVDYYTWASSHEKLLGVKKPLLTLNAADDPVVQVTPTGKSAESVVMAVTPGGGHLGWFESDGSVENGLRRWFTQPTIEWFKMLEERVMHDGSEVRKWYRTSDGWLKEEGGDREHLGVRVLEGEESKFDEMDEGRREGLLQGL